MCDNCKTLQKQLDAANNYYMLVMDYLGKLAKAAGLKSEHIAKLDAVAAIKEITTEFTRLMETQIAAKTPDDSQLAASLEVWQENLEWLEQTEFEPADIDRMIELLELLGYSGARLQYVLAAADMAQAMKHI